VALLFITAVGLTALGCGSDEDDPGGTSDTAPATAAPAPATAAPAPTTAAPTTAAPTTAAPTTAAPTTAAPAPATAAPTTEPEPGEPCELGSFPDCIDPEGDGTGIFLLDGAACMVTFPDSPGLCSDLDGDGYAGYPDSG
jgi:hypothetical protein